MPDNKLQRFIMHAWMRRGWFACLLWPLAQLFGALLVLRRGWYRLGWLQQQKLSVPVIVVGNIFVGGTGKTPFTLWLLEQLKQAGYIPGVVSRGYGSQQHLPQIVSRDALATQVGDEPILLAQSGCPVVVGRNRAAAGQTLLSAYPAVNVIIADDGLQHLALARDVEIMLFDGRGVGNGWLLPAGPLREPVSRRRDVTVANLNPGELLNAAFPADTVRMQLNGDCTRQLLNSGNTRLLSNLDAGLRITAAAGIGNPERFFYMLRQQGLRFASLPLPDHFNFASNPFAAITADMILITEKDAVKCRQVPEIASDPRIWVVAVVAQVEAGVLEKILKLL